MIPETLEGWTLEVVRELLHQGVFESDRFDFKETLPHPREEEGKIRLVKTCTAFANSDGGFLVVGVRDDKGLTVEDRLVGIAADLDFPEHFGNFPSAAQPSVGWTFRNPPLPLPSGKVIHIVHVPSSPRRPHSVLHDGRWWFCKRTSKGTEGMSLDEIRGAFVGAARRRSLLLLLRSEVERIGRQANETNLNSRDGRMVREVVFARYGAEVIERILPDVFSDLARVPDAATDIAELRTVIGEADRLMSSVSQLRTEDEVQAVLALARRDARRVGNFVSNCLRSLPVDVP